jgi:methyltransferase (TIGR00027 family)
VALCTGSERHEIVWLVNPLQASKTALLVTLFRALDHELLRPPVLGDAFAARLLEPDERLEYENAVVEMFVAAHPELADVPRSEAIREGCRRNRATIPSVLARARHADDALAGALERGLTQYAIVGAGFDTFALRRPDLARRLHIFELDHPATQAEKRRRLERAGLPLPAAHHFAACDFETDDVDRVLARLPFDRSAPTFFAWLGVAFYLMPRAIAATLRSIRRAADRCELVFDYRLRSSLDPANQSAELRALRELTRRYGEPIVSGFDPATLREELGPLGFDVVEDASPSILHERYFKDRDDGFSVGPFGHSVHTRGK